MNKLLYRYIVKALVSSTALVSLVIISILFLISLLTELKSIGSGEYGLMAAMIYVLLRLPYQLYQFSPLLILLGCITGLSVLTSHRELAVMRASGFSTRQIIAAILTAALFMIMSITIVGEWIGPGLSHQAEVTKENAKNGGDAVVTASGVWMHVGNNFIHVQNVIGRQLLEDVTRYQFDDNHKLKAAYFAKTLAYKDNKWQMYDAVKTTFFDGRTKSETFAKADWDLKFNSNLLNLGLLEPNEMTLAKLASLAHYLEKNGLQASEYKYSFWQRIFQPLSSLVMLFLAIPFVLGALRSTTLGWRLMVGILSGFVFFILNALLGELSIVYQIPAMFAASMPLMLFALFGIFLSRGVIRR